MQDEKFSCIKEINTTIHIPVPSMYVTNEVVGVTEILESWKRQYVHQLHGVVVDYKNVSVTLNAGHIVTDKHFSHYDVNATFSVFCPVIGSLAKGTVNRISKAHIGCLILNTINVTIHLTKNLCYSKVEKFLQLDREIIFEISHFNFDRKVIRVNGEITEECISLMKSMYPDVVMSANASTNKSESTEANENSSSDESSESESILKERNTTSHLTSTAVKKLVLTPVNKSVRSKHPSANPLGVEENNDFSTKVKEEKDGERENIDICPEDKMLKKKHKKKKQDSFQIADLDDNFMCSLMNEVKDEPNLSSSSIEVPNKQRKRKRESSSSLDQSSFDLSKSVDKGHRNKKRKHKKNSELLNFAEDFKLNEIKEEPIFNLLKTVDVNKQKKRKRKSSSSEQSSLDLSENVDFSQKKESKSESTKSLEISDNKKEKKKKRRNLSSPIKNTPNSVMEKKHKKKISNKAKKNFSSEGQISELKVSEESSESSEKEIKVKIEKCDDELTEADLEFLKTLENNSFSPEKCSSVNIEVKEETKSRQKVKKKKHKHSPDKKLKSIKEHSVKKSKDKALKSSKKKSSKKKDSKYKEKSILGSKIKKSKKKDKDKKSKKSSRKKE